MAAAQVAENHGDEWGLTWYLQWGIYTSIPAWTHSQNSLAAIEPLSFKILSHGASLKWLQRPYQSAWIVLMYVMKCFEFIGKSVEIEMTTWLEFPNGGKAILEQILVSEERNKSKRAVLWELQSGIQVGKLTIWVRSFETEKS